MPLRPEDLVEIRLAGRQAGEEDLPHPCLAPQPHRMPPAVPVVEGPDDRHPPRIRRPDGEAHPSTPAIVIGWAPEDAAEFAMRALGKEVQIERPERGPEGVGIVEAPLHLPPAGAQPIRPFPRHRPGEQPARIKAGKSAQHLACRGEGLHPLRPGDEGAHHPLPPLPMRAEHGEGVAVAAFAQGGDVLSPHRRIRRRRAGGGGAAWAMR